MAERSRAEVVPLLACAPDGQQRVDPAERISFRVPADWVEAPGSNGTRFSPPVAAAREAHINVNAVDAGSSATLEEERDAWLAAQEASGR